jgi:hypothetical protein
MASSFEISSSDNSFQPELSLKSLNSSLRNSGWSSVLPQQFQAIAGSVQGRERQRIGVMNQDTYWIQRSENSLVAVVCDGCGSRPYSQVGSHLGSRLLGEALTQVNSGDIDWERLHRQVLDPIRDLAQSLGGDFSETILDYFLFTCLGVVLTSENALFFACGDGVFGVNGKVSILDSSPDNAPPYLAYALLDPMMPKEFPSQYAFRILDRIPVSDIDTLWIGTDGVVDFIKVTQELEPEAAFWDNPLFFEHPKGLQRYLNRLNQDKIQPNWEQQRLVRHKGSLPDDTTLVMIRKA